jgi:adenosyl cobinamide kinase/adenosyl cobinamide phosphate guanylyltransferase
MTKKEIRSQINKAVYEFAEKMGYKVSDDADGSYVTFRKQDDNNADNTIDYHRSRHDAICLNWADAETKADTEAINMHAANMCLMFNI